MEIRKFESSSLYVKFISKLFESRDKVHLFHLQTKSYATHKALQEYYEGILDLTDTLVEVYQGKYGILEGYEISVTDKDKDAVKHLTNLSVIILKNRDEFLSENDTDLLNITDEVLALINQTLYKLKFLS